VTEGFGGKPMTGKAYIGTSGWNYQGWKDGFYQGVPKKNWLEYCAGKFPAIEVNATFYGLQKKSTFDKWRQRTPDAFRFAIKGNRFLTHNKKLLDPLDSIRLEQERASGLGEKLKAVLWQLPGKLQKDAARLGTFADALGAWDETRHAVEFRHPSWFDDEIAGILSHHRIAVCMSDAADWPLWDKVTTDLVYIRLHGHERTYASAYGPDRLREWAKRLTEWMGQGYEAHVYFDNDAEGAAPYDALSLLELVTGPPADR